MIGVAMYTTIKTLWKQKYNKSQIATITGHNWRTVSKIIKRIESGVEVPIKKPHPKKLDKYKEQIIEWLEEGLTGIRIKEKLVSRGQHIGKTCVHDYIRFLRRRRNIFVRIHTEAGKEAQVDFGYAGYTRDNAGKRRKTWIFNMRLSYSRLDYYEAVYDQKVETFIQCHKNAFRYFGGIPEVVKIDNLKAAILEANFYEPIYQGMYKSFAEHYSFQPIPCRVRQPNDKGKVESGIKYVKRNFFLGRKFDNADELRKRLMEWLDNKANRRVHGTTRKIPYEMFEAEEKEKLIKLPDQEYKISQVGSRKVYHDCHIYVSYNYYSVPYEYAGKEVEIEINNSLVKITYEYRQIAVHKELKGKGLFSTEKSHYPKYKCLSETEFQEKYQAKMASIGNYAEQIFFLVKEHKKNSWGRTIQGIISLSKKHKNNVINLSCKRALAYNVSDYQTIKNICDNGSYKLPCEFFKEVNYEYNKI